MTAQYLLHKLHNVVALACPLIICCYMGLVWHDNEFYDTLFRISSQQSPSYIGGVVEYSRETMGTAEERTRTNLMNYIKFVQEAERQGVDIIVFPEATLNSINSSERDVLKEISIFVPDPEYDAIPCESKQTYSEILHELSCQARKSKLYIVVNLSEKASCNKKTQAELENGKHCACDDISIFNTNVVFDRHGRVISRYRKFNLFVEPEYNSTTSPEISTFETDFGVTFGQFICFDVLFKTPAITLIKLGIRDIVYPTMWYSQLPFLTAVQFHVSWAYKNDVNFLAADANAPTAGSSGSGIYHGKSGALVAEIYGKDTSRLLVSSIPKYNAVLSKVGHNVDTKVKINENESSNNDNPFLLDLDRIKVRTENLRKYSTAVLETPGEQRIKLCSSRDRLCCSFHIITEHLPLEKNKMAYTYRIGVFTGSRKFGAIEHASIMVCAIFACLDYRKSTCGLRFPDHTHIRRQVIFTKINIEGIFPENENVLTLPTTLTDSLLPFTVNKFDYDEIPDETYEGKQIKITLTQPVQNLLTFGIYGRDFSKDYNADRNGGCIIFHGFNISIIIFLLYLFINKYNNVL